MQLTLRLLGTFEVVRAGRLWAVAAASERRAAVEPLPMQRHGPRALLAYLALEAGRTHPREHLAALLWPDATGEQALTNLRQALHRLRVALGLPDGVHGLVVTRYGVRLERAALELDVATFAAQLRAAAQHQHAAAASCDSCAQQLRAAVELYRGPLLPGLQTGASLPLEAWLLERREQLHQGYVGALAALVARHEACGEDGEAAGLLRRWLAAEPWCEEAHVRLMLLHWRQGARSAALRQYERCRVAMAAELAAEPALHTRTIAEAIRRDEAPDLLLAARAIG